MEHLPPTTSLPRRASPSGKPQLPPRVTRASTMALQNKSSELVGLQLVAALDETYAPPTSLVSPFGVVRRARSDSTMSSDTFDGIYSLGDGVDDVDVDMVADDELGELDVDDVGDVFRPGALVDRRLDEAFGGTRTSDLERMLLASSVADDEEDTAAVIAHLAHLDSMQLAQEKAQSKPEKGGFCVLKPVGVDASVLVVAAAAVVDASDVVGSSQHLEIAAALPPKYVADQRCRAHKRTFGERTTSFNFRFPIAQEATELQEKASVVAAVSKKAGVKRGRSLFQEAAEDIACRNIDREEKENLPPVASPASEKAVESEEKMDGAKLGDESAETETKSEPVEEQSPVQQLQPQTPVRPISKTTINAFQTPLRRSVTAPVPSSHTFQTPVGASTRAVSKTPTAGVTVASTMSPAPSFDKIAVVHAKDTPGRVDKFEWTIRPREAIRSKTALFSTQPPTPQAEPVAEPLPPRYLGDASESPQKRRIHSTTFGSFARSFSFTATQ